MKSKDHALYLTSLAIFALIILTLPLFSFDGYSIPLNSISQLGGQWHPYAWVMNVFGFMLMGIAIVLLYAKLSLSQVSKILVMTFGLSMIAVSFFQHEPVAGYGIISELESNMHSVIANVMGVTISFFAVSLVFDKKASKQYRTIAFIAVMVSSLLSLCMVALPNYYGLTQRIMFFLILSWLYYVAWVKQCLPPTNLSQK